MAGYCYDTAFKLGLRKITERNENRQRTTSTKCCIGNEEYRSLESVTDAERSGKLYKIIAVGLKMTIVSVILQLRVGGQ